MTVRPIATMADAFTDAGKMGRVMRRPRHNFWVNPKPWAIQPTCIAPVLPGETLKNAFLQARTVTAPMRSPLIGWWHEHYLFYVPHIALDDAELFKSMMLDQSTDLSSVTATGDAPRYYYNNLGINWAQLCTKRIVEEFFRDEGEAWDVVTIDGLPAASIGQESWMNSLLSGDQISEGGEIPEDAANATLEDLDASYAMWEFLKNQQLTGMDYEDYLASQGVRGRTIETEVKPELVRYVKQWQYPSNTVNPSTGVPASAVSWAVSERSDKARFFKYPGFLVGITVTRPKVYMVNQESAAACTMLSDAFAWLPDIMAGNPWTSLKRFSDTQGPLAGAADEEYMVDVRDLFLYGDQFFSAAHEDMQPADAGTQITATLPLFTGANVQKRYPSEADADAVFTPAGDAADERIRSDGVWQFNILGRQRDHTPRSVVL